VVEHSGGERGVRVSGREEKTKIMKSEGILIKMRIMKTKMTNSRNGR